MKATINKLGCLLVKRGANMKQQDCPFYAEEGTPCGDWCPHFDTFTTSTTAEITICHGKRIVVPIANFTDERP